ncbi:MAG TPA: hypothetical protein VJK25_00495 [Patescibacteria group bacterium]|nr:hypothetical protein [Patescibacteria group bacterium]
MFDDKLNQQLAGAGNQQPFGSVDGLGSNPNQASAGKQDLPPVALPATGQPEVSPKPGRSIPGTEDIFADSEAKAASQPAPWPKATEPIRPRPVSRPPERMAGPPEPLAELPDDVEDEDGSGSKKFFWIGLVALIVILGAGGWFAYSQFFKSSPVLNLPSVNLNSVSPANLNRQFQEQVVNLNLNRNTNQAEEVVEPEQEAGEEVFVDSDRDGLTDPEEEQYGTDPAEADSDGDELFDREEVMVYQSDPLNPDTDGDGYLDGDEVQNGYDPLRPGSARLLDLNFEE